MKAIERRLFALEAVRLNTPTTELRGLDDFYRDQRDPQSAHAIQLERLYRQEETHEKNH